MLRQNLLTNEPSLGFKQLTNHLQRCNVEAKFVAHHEENHFLMVFTIFFIFSSIEYNLL